VAAGDLFLGLRGAGSRDPVGVGSWIERRARISPERDAIVYGQTSRSYAELASRIRRLAHALRAIGRGGGVVGWLGPNRPEFLEVLFATASLGGTTAPVNHRLEPDAIERLLGDLRPEAIVVDASVEDRVPRDLPADRIVVGGADREAFDYERLLGDFGDGPVRRLDEPAWLSDPCLLCFSSGTTGAPKGVVLTHGNVTWNVVNFLSSCDFRPRDVTLAVAPFFRVGGTGVNVLPVLFTGGTVVIPESGDPEEALGLMERHRVTVGFGNPDLLEALTRSPSWPTADLSSIRFVITGGAPVPERLIQTYFDRGITFVQGYGLSEAGPLVLVLEQDRALTKAGAAGKPPILVEVRVVRDDSTECEVGEVGELVARGPNVSPGYWHRSEGLLPMTGPSGWLHTGDAARVDEDGDVWIVDRVHDRYVIDGRPVYPGQVERVLLRHPAVREAGVVGVDRGGGLRGAAFVVLEPGASVTEPELYQFGRELWDVHEVPASITFVEALPRSSVGKLLRDELCRLAEERPQPS
jgi:fatty-acyl-CoA synthase